MRHCIRHRVYSLSPQNGGWSFAEMMVVLGVIGIIVAIGIPMISNVVPSTKKSTAEANLQQLNKAVLKFNQAAWELYLASNESSSEDEVSIVRSLQYRDPNSVKATMGSPYLAQTMSIVASDSPDTYRAFWNGRMFQVIYPGTQGEGIDLLLLQEGGDTAQFATDYKPVGAK